MEQRRARQEEEELQRVLAESVRLNELEERRRRLQRRRMVGRDEQEEEEEEEEGGVVDSEQLLDPAVEAKELINLETEVCCL